MRTLHDLYLFAFLARKDGDVIDKGEGHSVPLFEVGMPVNRT